MKEFTVVTNERRLHDARATFTALVGKLKHRVCSDTVPQRVPNINSMDTATWALSEKSWWGNWTYLQRPALDRSSGSAGQFAGPDASSLSMVHLLIGFSEGGSDFRSAVSYFYYQQPKGKPTKASTTRVSNSNLPPPRALHTAR
jgi:hypothetical protein